MRRIHLGSVLVVLLMGSMAWADKRSDLPGLAEAADGTITVGGRSFASWTEYAGSQFFKARKLRCGCGSVVRGATPFLPSDCGLDNTNALPIYDPTVTYRIPVVVHVIQNSSGTGFLSAATVQSQIDILNEDFRALAGSNGAPGTDTQIEFYLPTTDPQGNPSTGITYSTSNQWFNDNGNYYDSLAWNPQEYLNIYTNTADGSLGYVPFLPQEGPQGTNEDRVVVLYSTFGANAPMAPYDLGRTTTHEVGHYLGLWHTFDNGCGSSSACATTGDRICDTPRQQFDTFGCPPVQSSCGSADPIHNYMDYSDDQCMNNFTVDQTRRMRCTLENYRPALFEIVGATVPPVTGLACVGSVGQAILNWQNAGAYTDILVERVGGPTVMLSGSATSYVSAGVPAGVHTYRVTAMTATAASNGAECTVAVSGASSSNFRRGDTNGDGGFDISDAIVVLSALFDGLVPGCENALDVNDDESVDLADAISLLQGLFGTGSLPPSPSLACGVDPTPGPLPCATGSGCP